MSEEPVVYPVNYKPEIKLKKIKAVLEKTGKYFDSEMEKQGFEPHGFFILAASQASAEKADSFTLSNMSPDWLKEEIKYAYNVMTEEEK